MDEQAQLVEQPGREELADHRDRPGDEHLADARLLLEGADRVDEVAVDPLDVPPPEVLVAARRDDLAQVPEPRGELRVLVPGGLPLGPRAGEAVVRDAPEQERVDVPVVLVHRRGHVVVEVGKVPRRVDLGDAVEREEQGGHERRGHERPSGLGRSTRGRPSGLMELIARRRTHP
ncbi:Uncharacterised protein [Mycobacteroides abscessus]|nr:Uncharacterised protein [Mycobacteroides abscessus]